MLTVIYYTSNREVPDFEQRIRANILKSCADLPIISVSQYAIDFGQNIVVGDVGATNFNMFRQIQIACENAKTKFVVSTESDCLYPPDYFTFIPEKDDVCYRNKNLYVMPTFRSFFWKKEGGATHAQVIGREYYLRRLAELFNGAPRWSVEERNFPKERLHKDDVFDEVEYYETENPVVQIKTSHAMRHYTVSDRVDRQSIPYWGSGKEVRKIFYDIGRRH